MNRTELFISVAIVLYIVFFAWSPPALVRGLLSSTLGMMAAFGGVIYVTLYKSRAIGALLLLAFVMSMTSVTEHLTQPEKPSVSDIAGASSGGASSTALPTSDMPSALPPTPPSSSTPASSLAGEAPRPESTSPALASPPVTSPPPSMTSPKPVASCNIETFASF